MATKRLWKTMLDGMKSSSGDLPPWIIGEWRKHDGPLEMCKSGFHASENLIDAFGYVEPGMICEVEVRGEHLEQDDKQVWSEMRVLRAWKWTKEDSVSLAVYAAELVIGIHENKCPDDDRPRKAIEAAKAWLKNPCKETKAAARAAAWDAARAAARAAAWDAARDAARAAWAAAWAAWAARAAGAAAYKDIMDKRHAFIVTRCEEKGD